MATVTNDPHLRVARIYANMGQQQGRIPSTGGGAKTPGGGGGRASSNPIAAGVGGGLTPEQIEAIGPVNSTGYRLLDLLSRYRNATGAAAWRCLSGGPVGSCRVSSLNLGGRTPFNFVIYVPSFRSWGRAGVDQGANISVVAEDMIRWHGRDAYSYLYDNAQLAKQAGDTESAITWWDIALAAVEILNQP